MDQVPVIGFLGIQNYAEKWLYGKLSKVFLHFCYIFDDFSNIFIRFFGQLRFWKIKTFQNMKAKLTTCHISISSPNSSKIRNPCFCYRIRHFKNDIHFKNFIIAKDEKCTDNRLHQTFLVNRIKSCKSKLYYKIVNIFYISLCKCQMQKFLRMSIVKILNFFKINSYIIGHM